MSDKEQKAIKRIQMASEMSLHHYGKPLVCTYSGGKDSDVMLELFKRSGIPYEVHNNHTTADAPQTVRHIRETFHRLEQAGVPCKINIPMYDGERTSMWKLITKKLIPPTRWVRYCCEVLKENGVKNRYISTGVRWAESTKRKTRGEFEKVGKTRKDAENFSTVMLLEDNDSKRRMTELCMQKNTMTVNPIIDWTDMEIWEFIRSENILVCDLYGYGYDRVGCVGCPLAGKKRYREFADFPSYKKLYLHAFERMLEERSRRGKESTWSSAEEVFLWWMEDDNIPGQMSIEGYLADVNYS